jgi:hypothetical protein
MTPIERENRLLFSKTPQVLSIKKDRDNDIITIIKSKMKNTRIHQPRYYYERDIVSILPELDLSNYQKYLKYKRKYLKLKKSIK